MNWSHIEPIEGTSREVDCLNRQIKSLLAFRAEVEKGDVVGRFYDKDDAENEALRREFMLRLDIARHLRKQKQDASAWEQAVETLNQALRDRGGHRS